MKKLFQTALILTIGLCGAANAQNVNRYELTITNGSQMPISPAVIYVKTGGESAARVGSQPSAAFVQLCETGSTPLRVSELKANAAVMSVVQTNGPILPGQSQVVLVDVSDPKQQSIHLETMYGKSKDICGVGSFNSHSLVALKQHVTTEVIQKDNTLVTGAFNEPVLPSGEIYPDKDFCATATNAIACLRELALANTGKKQIRFFSGYLPSLVTALEMKYGAAEVQTLLFSTSGAIQLKLKLKH